MGLFDVFDKASKNIEKSQQAREYLQAAKNYVREGDEIYAKAYNKVQNYASETQLKLYKYTEFKKKIAKEIGSDINITLKNFECFDVNSRSYAIETDVVIKALDSAGQFLDAFTSCIVSNPLSLPSILGMFISDEDYYNAKRARDEAKMYKQNMKYEKEKLMVQKDKLSAIRDWIYSEENEINSLMDKLRKLNNELKSAMNNNNFSEEEAKYLTGIRNISESIVKLLSNDFINNDLGISNEYKKSFERIKSINSSLPYTPSINETSTRNVLLDIIKY